MIPDYGVFAEGILDAHELVKSSPFPTDYNSTLSYIRNDQYDLQTTKFVYFKASSGHQAYIDSVNKNFYIDTYTTKRDVDTPNVVNSRSVIVNYSYEVTILNPLYAVEYKSFENNITYLE